MVHRRQLALSFAKPLAAAARNARIGARCDRAGLGAV